jgi:hypothetical protein
MIQAIGNNPRAFEMFSGGARMGNAISAAQALTAQSSIAAARNANTAAGQLAAAYPQAFALMIQNASGFAQLANTPRALEYFSANAASFAKLGQDANFSRLVGSAAFANAVQSANFANAVNTGQ